MTPQMKSLAEQLVGCCYAIEKSKKTDKKESLSHEITRLMQELAKLGVTVIPPSSFNGDYEFIWKNEVLRLGASDLTADLASLRYPC